MVNQQTYYGTMFDEGGGIAVFSAYTLTQANVNFLNRPRPGWVQTPGSYSLANTLKVNPHPNKGGYLPTLRFFSRGFYISNSVPF